METDEVLKITMWRANDGKQFKVHAWTFNEKGLSDGWSLAFLPEEIPSYISKGDPIEIFGAIRKVILQDFNEKEQVKRAQEKDCLYKSIQQVGKELRNLSKEEFERELDAHKEGDFCKILEYANAALYYEGKE